VNQVDDMPSPNGAQPDTNMTAIPLTCGFGLLHHANTSAHGDVGVVLCSAWGVDELSSRKTMFRLATQLADSGYPTLRFDYPGTADAIWDGSAGLAEWIDATSEAIDRLKATCGLQSVVMIGLGLGATVATLAAQRREDVSALVLAAPVVSGRRFLRQIAISAAVIEEGLGLKPSQRPSGVAIAGIVMPLAVADALQKLDLTKEVLDRRRPVLILARKSQPQDAAFADHLSNQGWQVDQAEFEGYDEAMENPTVSVLPTRAIRLITEWTSRIAPYSGSSSVATPHSVQVSIHGGGYSEEPVVFGQDLFGVITQPDHRSSTPLVVFLNSGYDYHAGWAYQWTRSARTLAGSGIASLRFDLANIGDSAANPGAAEQVLYSDECHADIGAALDMLAARGESRIMLVGRCSGAFTAFHMAARDARVSGAVLINPLRFIWDPSEDVDVALKIGPRPVAVYRQRAKSANTLKRLVIGDIDLLGVTRSLGTLALRRFKQLAAPALGSFSKITRQRQQCHEMLRAIGSRALVHILCSEGDASIEQMSFYFGAYFEQLLRFKNVSMTIVPDADHNMTPEPAQQTVIDTITNVAVNCPQSPVMSPQTQQNPIAQAAYPPMTNGG